MDDLLCGDEPATLAEVGRDLVGRLCRREPVEPAEVVVEPARVVDGLKDAKVVDT